MFIFYTPLFSHFDPRPWHDFPALESCSKNCTAGSIAGLSQCNLYRKLCFKNQYLPFYNLYCLAMEYPKLYCLVMKTAVSIPKDIFVSAEQLAKRLNISRDNDQRIIEKDASLKVLDAPNCFTRILEKTGL